MAARFALQPFVYHDTVANADITIIQGSTRDSVTGQAFLESPASFWSSSALVAGSQIDPKLAAWIAVYPSGGVS